MNLQERKVLQCISGNALTLSQKIKNPYWVKAYEALASSADYLDAMIERTRES